MSDCAWDALTTFGVRIWKPEIKQWREVSVNGGIHEPRTSANKAGSRILSETPGLTNGTIIDLAGIQLVYESAESMQRAPSTAPRDIIDTFNGRNPQCPVHMHTIRFEYDDAKRSEIPVDRKPFVYPACGHVHAFAPELQRMGCPLCRRRGPFVELKLEWEPAICRDTPTVVLNPCGHIVSQATAVYWSQIELPDNAPPNARYRPICPFCARPLKSGETEADRPYNPILFQQGLEDDAPTPI